MWSSFMLLLLLLTARVAAWNFKFSLFARNGNCKVVVFILRYTHTHFSITASCVCDGNRAEREANKM